MEQTIYESLCLKERSILAQIDEAKARHERELKDLQFMLTSLATVKTIYSNDTGQTITYPSRINNSDIEQKSNYQKKIKEKLKIPDSYDVSLNRNQKMYMALDLIKEGNGEDILNKLIELDPNSFTDERKFKVAIKDVGHVLHRYGAIDITKKQNKNWYMIKE